MADEMKKEKLRKKITFISASAWRSLRTVCEDAPRSVARCSRNWPAAGSIAPDLRYSALLNARGGWNGAGTLHEYNVGANCGAYWSGVKDSRGIPDATMSDGTPNGWAVLNAQRDGRYRLRWRNAGPEPEQAMALHAPKVLRQGAYPAFGVFANVFMALPDARVEFRVADGPWQPMQRVPGPDPRLMAENRRDDEAEALRGFDRSPEADVSTHLWRGTLPTDLPAGEHLIQVRTTDPWRGELTAQTRYRLDEAAP
jgi:hypothetical protein